MTITGSFNHVALDWSCSEPLVRICRTNLQESCLKALLSVRAKVICHSTVFFSPSLALSLYYVWIQCLASYLSDKTVQQNLLLLFREIRFQTQCSLQHCSVYGDKSGAMAISFSIPSSHILPL